MPKPNPGPAAAGAKKPVREPWIIRTYAGFGDARHANLKGSNASMSGHQSSSTSTGKTTQRKPGVQAVPKGFHTVTPYLVVNGGQTSATFLVLPALRRSWRC